MPVSDFTYTPIPEERRVDENDENKAVEIPKWAQYAVNDFGTKTVAYEDRENWGVILKTFGIAMAMLIIIIVVLLIGLIYLCLRCKGYLNPIKDYAERSNQRCVRCILTCLMLILLAGILYFIIMGIKNSNSKRPIHEEKNSTKTHRGLDHVFGLNYEEFQEQARRSADDLIHNWTESTASVSEASKNLCPPAENITDVNKRVADVNNEFKLLCLGVLEWSDYMRFFYRNMTTFMIHTGPGRKILKEIGFQNFLSRTMQVEKLLDFYRIFSIVDKFFYSFSKLYNTTVDWPVNLQSMTKNALSPYFLEITKDLDDKGSKFRSLSTKLASERGVDDTIDDEYNERADKGEKDNNDDKSNEPLWIYILDIICYTLLLLITVILLIALLLRCCGARHRSEAKCCNQENGSCLFQFAAFLMFLFLLLVLYPFLWHFVHGAGRYSSECVANGKNQSHRFVEFSEHPCLDEKNFKKILNDHVDKRINLNLPDKSTAGNVNMSAPAPALQKYAINFKQSARTSKNLDLTNMCEDIKNSTDPKHLTDVYTQIYKYANGDMPQNELKTLSLCNLQCFKTHRIDKYEQSVVFISATRLASYCNRVVEFFKENYAKITGECLNSIENLKDEFSNQSKHQLSEIIEGLNNMYAKELDGYVDMATDRLVNKVGFCRKAMAGSNQTTNCDANIHLQNVTWSTLLILIWLVLPLIPIALYLARLYGTCRSIGTNCCCEQRADDRWDTNSVMDEMQCHLYKSLCEGSARTGTSNGQCECRARRGGCMHRPNCRKRCLNDVSANFAMMQQANTLLLKGKSFNNTMPPEETSIPKPKQISIPITKQISIPITKQIKEPQAPTTSKGMKPIIVKQLVTESKIETSSFKKCVCDKNTAYCNKNTNGPSSSMARAASSRPRKEMRNVCEELDEIVEEGGKNGLNANASIHIINFNKK